MQCNVVRYMMNGKLPELEYEEVSRHNNCLLLGPMDMQLEGSNVLRLSWKEHPDDEDHVVVHLHHPKIGFIDHWGHSIIIVGYRHVGTSIFSKERWVVTPTQVECADA